MYEIIGIIGMILSLICAHRYQDTNFLVLAGLFFVGISIIELPKYFFRLLIKALENMNTNLDEMINKIKSKKENEENEGIE